MRGVDQAAAPPERPVAHAAPGGSLLQLGQHMASPQPSRPHSLGCLQCAKQATHGLLNAGRLQDASTHRARAPQLQSGSARESKESGVCSCPGRQSPNAANTSAGWQAAPRRPCPCTSGPQGRLPHSPLPPLAAQPSTHRLRHARAQQQGGPEEHQRRGNGADEQPLRRAAEQDERQQAQRRAPMVPPLVMDAQVCRGGDKRWHRCGRGGVCGGRRRAARCAPGAGRRAAPAPARAH